ncbi:MAG: hypothetical protein LUF92_06820 [Clostridiales bacterium]|nr:hypothetical protein [Clostridiales bacterium]
MRDIRSSCIPRNRRNAVSKMQKPPPQTSTEDTEAHATLGCAVINLMIEMVHMDEKVKRYEDILAGLIPDDSNPMTWTKETRPRLYGD